MRTAHADGALVIDETGDRKDGTHTAHVGYQYLGSIGKLGNGIVAVTSLWADERVYHPLHVRPTRRPRGRRVASSTRRFVPSRSSPSSWCKPRAAGIRFHAVVADGLYGEHPEFTRILWQ